MGHPRVAGDRRRIVSGDFTMALGRRTLLSVAASAVIVTAAGGVRARPLQEVMDAGTIIIAVYQDFAPYSHRVDGELVGIDVDIARGIAKGLGVDLALQEQMAGETVSHDLRAAVWRGNLVDKAPPADVMLHIPFDRRFALMNPEAVLFGPYHREVFALARNPQRMPDRSLEAFPDGQRIGVELDSVPDFYLLSAFGGRLRETIVHYKTGPDAIRGMMDGEVAAVIAPLTQIEPLLGKDSETWRIAEITFPGLIGSAHWDIGMAVKENSRDLAYAVGDAVTAMINDGAMAEIYRRHGATHRPVPIDD